MSNASRSLQEWFDLYGESHRNPTNKRIHFVCVPGIYFTILGLLWVIPVPQAMAQVPWLNWATLSLLVTLPFYLRLSLAIGVGMLLVSLACFAALDAMVAAGLPVLWLMVGLFVLLWIGQFVGHAVEGRKPSFFQDLQFLLIGPAWVLGFLYAKVGLKA